MAHPKSVVFVHGMFVTPACWSPWIERFAAAGYRAVAPAWPGHGLPPAEQRDRHPDPELAKLTLDDLVAHYRGVVEGLDDEPIVIGHSMGGLVAQLLLQEDLTRGAVAIDSAPPKGLITLKWSFLKSNWPSISPTAPLDEPVFMDLDDWKYGFTNTMSPEDQERSWREHAVPESRRVGKGPTTPIAAIDFTKSRAPLLLIAGGADHMIPAVLNRKNFSRYEGDAITDFEEFEGRDHFSIIGGAGWEEVADHVLAWITERIG